jgi:hypothetical protein
MNVTAEENGGTRRTNAARHLKDRDDMTTTTTTDRYDTRARELMLTGDDLRAYLALNRYADQFGFCPACGQLIDGYETTRVTHARTCQLLTASVTTTPQFSDRERFAIERARQLRAPADWKRLPTVTCAIDGQRFYQEHPRQTLCRDCMGDSGFYPVPATEPAKPAPTEAAPTDARRVVVMFNGSVYQGQLIRETAKRLRVRFTVPSSNTTRVGWFAKVDRPVGELVGRRVTLKPGQVTIPANSGFVLEGGH